MIAGYLRTIAWIATAVVLTLIAIVAIVRLIDLGVGSEIDASTMYGRTALLFVTGYVFCAAVLLATAWRLDGWSVRHGWLVPVGIVLLATAIRAVVAVTIDAPLTGESRIIHEQAVGVMDGASCCFSHRPMGYPLALAGAYAVFGIGPGAIEALNIACAALTTWMVFDIGRVAWDRRVGVLAATTFAIVPSQVLMALPPLTEPLYTAVVAIIVRVVIGAPSRPLVAAATAGLMIAAAQYVRATAAPLLAPVVLLPLVAGERVRRWAMRGLITVAVFVVALLPVVSFNLQTHGDLSVSTSAYAGWSLFVGANQESSGRWNQEDSALFASLPGNSAWEKSAEAGELGVRRILDDPGGYLRMQPRKFAVLWGDESYAAAYTLTPAGAPATPETSVGWLLSQLFYAPLIVLALVGVILERERVRPAVLLIGMAISMVAATHAFLEVHSRYHAYLVPLVVLLAAGGVDALVRRYRSGQYQ